MIKYCSDTPNRCGLPACLAGGCILNTVSTNESYHDKVYRKMTEGFVPAESYSDRCARLEIGEFKVPELIKKVKNKKRTSTRRINETGHFKCFEHLIVNGYVHCHYCYVPLSPSRVSRDHLLAKSKGGKSARYNIVTACRKCNEAKADMDYYDFLQKARSFDIFLCDARRKELTVHLNIML